SAKSSTIVIAVIVPSVLIIVFLTLVIMNRRRGFIIPRLVGHNDAAVREERMKKRQNELESSIKTQHFDDWLAAQKEKNPGSLHTTDPVCAICLDEFAEDAQIRGLRCSHAFHAACLDEWFTRYNEYCPLCHGPIIPGRARRGGRERATPIPVILMV
ncbi:uncharacterized protein K460DRAFT_252760, partial [Cucurbitaria berberidis CBS 394.84]